MHLKNQQIKSPIRHSNTFQLKSRKKKIFPKTIMEANLEDEEKSEEYSDDESDSSSD